MMAVRIGEAMTRDGARPRLLYVEDDPTIAGMTVEVLSEVYDVTHLTDGLAARDRVLTERFDVLVVDRRLPGLDGVEIVQAMRTARLTTPVLLLTALGAVADRVDGLDSGANDYLVKPFDFDELLARLRALVRGHHAEGRRRHLQLGEHVHPGLRGVAGHQRGDVGQQQPERPEADPAVHPRDRVAAERPLEQRHARHQQHLVQQQVRRDEARDPPQSVEGVGIHRP